MLTQEKLRELIDYNPETGMAFWKVNRRRARAGERVGYILTGSKRSKPYRYVSLKESGRGRIPFTHLVNFYMTGRWPAVEMDHIHGDTLDDRWAELRESTRQQNEANRGPKRNNKLGIKGVVLTPSGKYYAKFWRGKHIYVGLFDTQQAAQEALIVAMKPYDGEFMRAA